MTKRKNMTKRKKTTTTKKNPHIEQKKEREKN